MNGGVWLPESSLSDRKPPDTENKEREKKTKIIRRTTPTVIVHRPRQAKNGGADGLKKRNYSTIETSSYNRSSLHLALSHTATKNVQNSTSQLTCKKSPEVCGWETYGGHERHLQSSSTFSRCAAERASLITPADGYRSGVQSRACSRASENRKKSFYYEFKHFPDTHSHIEDYCTQYSYSALTLSRQTSGTDALREASAKLQEEIRRNQGKQVSKCLVNREEGGGNTLYMQQLASRLGVGVMKSINEKQLRCRPQPTPQSFTKKSRVADDLVVSTQDEKSPSQEQECVLFTPLPQGQSLHDAELSTRVLSSLNQNRPLTGTLSTAPDPLEFPKIMARLRTKNKKTLSTSSVTKYLTVNRRTHHSISLGLGEEESAVDISSHGSLAEEDVIPEKTEPSVRSTAVSLGKEVQKNCQPPAMTDEGLRERVLAQKAQALGLLSRDWAQRATTYDQQTHNMMKNPHMKGNNRPSTRADIRRDTRPTTRADVTRPTTRADTTRRPITRADVRPNNQYRFERDKYTTKPHTETDSKPSSTKGDNSTSYRHSQQHSYQYHSREPYDSTTAGLRTTIAERASEKLKKMMNIYEPAGDQTQSKRSASRQQTYTRSRCETRLSRRPETRCDDVDISRKNKQSRPGTRLGKKAVPKRPGLESDESQYWNEVPNMTHRSIPKFHTNFGMHLRVSPRSIPTDDTIRLSQTVKQYSHTNKQRYRAQDSRWQARQHV